MIDLPVKNREIAFYEKCGDADWPVAKGSKIIAKSSKGLTTMEQAKGWWTAS